MNKLKLFIENFIVYGIGGVISKIIPLVMVPIITRMMPNTEYYGISDLSNTLISLGSALAVMGMYDAMYRMFFDKDDIDFKSQICTTTLVFTIFTSIVVFILMLVFKDNISLIFFEDKKYVGIVYISAIATLIGATNSIVSAPTRMENKRGIFIVTNTVGPIISYAIAIILLLRGNYLIALPLSALFSSVIMEFSFILLNKKWFKLKKFDKSYLKPLLSIAIPLLPNFLIYWVFNSCDKIMITNMIGIGAAGIYSVGSKLGNCSQLIYTAFAGGWQYFAFSTMKEKNQVESNSRIFEYLGILSFIVTAFICAWSNFIFRILFTKEYIDAYIVAPYLFLAPLLQMLFQVAANQFIVVKKTWPNIPILLSGVIFNLCANYVLIPIIGIEGAAIATLIGYFVADVICVLVLIKMKLMMISVRFIFSSCIFVFFIFLWRFFIPSNIIIGTFVAIIITIIILLFYKKDILSLFCKK